MLPRGERRPLRNTVLAGVALAGIVAGFYLLARHNAQFAMPDANSSQQRPSAPDFSLPNLSGQQVALSSYKGKVVLLDFWATWCEPCQQEIPEFVNLQHKYQEDGLQIIGVSMDDGPAPVRDFSRRFKMNYPVVMGSAKTGELYGGVLGLPTAFLIGRDGRIYFKHVGAVDLAVLEREIQNLVESKPHSGTS